jgi:hypothetical protein
LLLTRCFERNFAARDRLAAVVLGVSEWPTSMEEPPTSDEQVMVCSF